MRRLGRRARTLALLGVLAGAGVLAWAASNVRQGYAPRQPLYFRHTRMAGDPRWTVDDRGDSVNAGGYSVPCVYCHTMPYKGRHSTVPSTAVCMNCHGTVGQTREWVLKLKEYWDRGQPVAWVKVHDLPDFVYYDHSAHLNARDAEGRLKLPLACETCHGRVQDEDIVRVQVPFNMGWCVGCHRQAEMHASTDCSVCHR